MIVVIGRDKMNQLEEAITELVQEYAIDEDNILLDKALLRAKLERLVALAQAKVIVELIGESK